MVRKKSGIRQRNRSLLDELQDGVLDIIGIAMIGETIGESF